MYFKKFMNHSQSFMVQVGNYEWYQKQTLTCCSKLEQHVLPIFKPSTPDVKAGGVSAALKLRGLGRAMSPSPLELPGGGLKSPGTQRKDSTRTDSVTAAMSSLSLVLSLGKNLCHSQASFSIVSVLGGGYIMPPFIWVTKVNWVNQS